MKIRDIRCMLLTAPIPQDKQFTSDIGTWKACHAAIAVVETDEGITGYGEAAGKSPLTMKSIIEHDLKPLLVGEDPTRVTYLWERMHNGTRLNLSLFYGRSQPEPHAPGEFMCAMSGVDVALWDIAGKALGVPVHRLLGGTVRNRIRAYASGGHGTVDTIGDLLLSYVEKGFKACKMRVGGMDHPRMLAGSVARVKAAREAVGPDVQIMLDAHGSTGVTDAIKLARALEGFDIAWYEEPVIYHNFQGMAEVRRATSVPVATGECLYGRFSFRDLGLARAADIWQPDVSRTGGITEMLRIAHLASAMEFQLAPHTWGSALIWAATLQLAAALPNYLIYEFGQTYNPLLHDLVNLQVKIERDGCVEIPQKPGLGIEIIPDAEKQFPFDPSLPERIPAA